MDTMARRCPIWILSGASPDWSDYTDELLRLGGLASSEVVSREMWLNDTSRPAVAVVAGEGTGDDALMSSLRHFVSEGGWLVLFAPMGPLAELAGLEDQGAETGPFRLREILPLFSHMPGAPLEVRGMVRRYVLREGRELARLTIPDCPEESPGLVERPVGAGGVLTFCYPLPACVARLRQGDPALQGAHCQYDEVPRPLNLFQRDVRVDAAWYPQADLHARLLVDMIERKIAGCYPLPRLWHLPAESRALVLFSGDEDGASFDQTADELEGVARFGGTGTLYAMSGSSLTREQVRQLEAEGHDLSAHPNCREAYKDGGVEPALATAVRELETIRTKLGVQARTIRNHCLCWPGYLELAEVWERQGVRMDTNFVTGFSFWGRDWAPYMTGSGLPLRFCHLDGRRIEVYQQPTHFEDDVQLHPTVSYSYQWSAELALAIMARVLSESLEVYHEPICLNVHPTNFARYSGDWARAFLSCAAGRGVPIWSLERWLDFWETREQVTLRNFGWQGGVLSAEIEGPPHPDLRCLVPGAFGDLRLKQVELDGAPVAGSWMSYLGREWQCVPLSAMEGMHTVRMLYRG